MKSTKPKPMDAIERAKKIAAGPLGRETARYPLIFASPIAFGGRPRRDSEFKVKNATVSLLRLDCGPIAVTAQHVIEGYRKLADEGIDLILQIGDALIKDPLARLIDESKQHDLATLRLKEHELKAIGRHHEKISKQAYEPMGWPPGVPKVGDWVAFGGFPRRLRIIRSWNEIEFRTFSCGSTDITSVTDEGFKCRFDRESWVTHDPDGVGSLGFKDFGGLSGGPVFLLGSSGKLTILPLVGFVTEFGPNFDVLCVAHAKHIRRDGTTESR